MKPEMTTTHCTSRILVNSTKIAQLTTLFLGVCFAVVALLFQSEGAPNAHYVNSTSMVPYDLQGAYDELHATLAQEIYRTRMLIGFVMIFVIPATFLYVVIYIALPRQWTQDGAYGHETIANGVL